MKYRIASVVVVATLLAGAAHAASKNPKPTVNLDHAATVGEILLPAGAYQIDLVAGSDLARFVQGNRTVVEVPCKVAFAEVVYPGNAVHVRNGEGGPDRLVKIVLASSKIAIEFPDNRVAVNQAPAANAAGRP